MALIKDPGPLSYDYLRPELPHRERQLEEMSRLFERVRNGGAQNLMLKGRVGTGKTASARLFTESLISEMSGKGRRAVIAYVNCRSKSSSHSVLLSIVREFSKDFPAVGFSEDYMMESIAKHLEREKAHLIVILDEIDYLLRRAGSDVIYKLGRFSEYTGKPQNISVIGISQQDAISLMDDAARSTFRRSNVVSFPQYSANELSDIIRQRAELSLAPGSMTSDSIELMAEISARDGDARYAIELLERAALVAQVAGNDQIRAEHVRRASAENSVLTGEESLESLSKHELLVFLGALRRLRSSAYATTGEVEEEYRAVCEEYGDKPRGHTQFWKYLNNIELEGLLSMELVSGKGRTKRISTDLPVDDMISLVEKRLGL